MIRVLPLPGPEQREQRYVQRFDLTDFNAGYNRVIITGHCYLAEILNFFDSKGNFIVVCYAHSESSVDIHSAITNTAMAVRKYNTHQSA